MMTTRKALLKNISTLQHLFVLISLFNFMCAQQSERSTDDRDLSPGCHSNAFPCYKDCCTKGAWFCHHAEERCYHCSTRESLCGNESLPMECLLYCYKLQNPPPTCPKQDNADSVCLPSAIFASLAVVEAVAIIGIATFITVRVCARRRPPEGWPVCLRAALGLRAQRQLSGVQGEKDTNATEEGHPLLEPTNTITKGIAAEDSKTNLHTSSSGSSLPPSSASVNSNLSADMEELNLTAVNDEDTDNQEQPREAQAIGDPPAAMLSGDGQGTGNIRASDSVGSCCGTTLPLAGGGQGVNTDDGNRAGGDNRGNLPPPISSWSCGGSTLPRHGPRGADAEAGQECVGRNGELPSTYVTPTPPGRGTITGQGPDPRDVEVGSQDFPGIGPARDRNASLEGAEHHGNSPAPPQPVPQPPFVPQANEVLSKPDFSKMNPTPGTDKRRVIATGTTNPAKNYVQHSMQDLPSPQ